MFGRSAAPPSTDMAELLRKIDLLTNSVTMLHPEVSEQGRRLDKIDSSRESGSDVSRSKPSKGKGKRSRVEAETEKQLKVLQV